MPLEKDIREIRNDVDRIKQDISSINRVQVLASSTAIIQNIKNAVGKSKLMIAALFIARDWISAGELSAKLKINLANLNKVVKRLVDNGLLYNEKRGRNIFYKRTSMVDLIGFENIDEFLTLYKAWEQGEKDEN